ncbi:MAG: WecB/TagA/CpsF family glycosyltransferase [Truepera sp.]|nr:WecB/TagA/CpsF family glycosyltransferase [Truepera sp.]
MSHAPADPPVVPLLGYRVAAVTLEEAAQWCLQAVHDPRPKLLVTTNPELIVQAEANPDLKEALLQAELTVADGVGVVWAARRWGCSLPERVPGVEVVTRVLELGGGALSVYFLGAKPGVAQRAAAVVQKRFGTRIAGTQHGYFGPDETPTVIGRIAESGAQLLLAGLGEGQELFLHQHRRALGVPLMIGVGGTLDVLSGTVKRTPRWTRRLGLEWAWRVGLDPKRWRRFPRLLAFVRLVLADRP